MWTSARPAHVKMAALAEMRSTGTPATVTLDTVVVTVATVSTYTYTYILFE